MQAAPGVEADLRTVHGMRTVPRHRTGHFISSLMRLASRVLDRELQAIYVRDQFLLIQDQLFFSLPEHIGTVQLDQ